MLTSGVVLLHDNACPHTAAHTWALLEHFNWSCLTTLYIALISLWVTATCLSTWRTGWDQFFSNNEELMEGVKTWLSSQVADSFDIGTQEFISWYNNCLSSSGDYVEKQLKYVHIFCI
jgi:hypothetical protein